MDPLSAHLDRGWTLVAQRDYGAARASAQQVLSRDPEHAEGLTLLGMAEMGAGDLEAALEAFDAASGQDPDYLAPVLYGAEALAADPHRIEEALDRLEEAYGLAEPHSAEHIDIVLLHVDLLIASNQDREARRRLLALDPKRDLELDQRIQAGKFSVELDAIDFAGEVLAALDPESDLPADALYALARVAEREEAFDEALRLFLRVHAADVRELPQRSLPEPRELERLCRDAIGRLPKRLAPIVADVEIRVLDLPAVELVADGLDPRLPLLVTGPPLPPEVAPTPRAFHIFLYRANLAFEPAADPEPQLEALQETLAVSLERFGD